MSIEAFVTLMKRTIKPKLKLNTWRHAKEHIIRTKILPYFKKRKLSEITARDVIDWAETRYGSTPSQAAKAIPRTISRTSIPN